MKLMDSRKHVGLYAAGCHSLGVAAAQVYALFWGLQEDLVGPNLRAAAITTHPDGQHTKVSQVV